MNEQQVAKRLLEGDTEAFSMFYRAHEAALRRFFYRKVSDREQAEELVQDSFIGFFESLRDFRGQCSMKTFLYTIANHKVIDHYRKKKLRHLLFSQAPFIGNLLSTIGNPEELFERGRIADNIRYVFALLLPVHRRVLQLKYVEGKSVSEIARLLTITIKSAESHLFRARKAFINAYENK
jgi:RNA polymerase sigma-70 factor (ECF subfamily)